MKKVFILAIFVFTCSTSVFADELDLDRRGIVTACSNSGIRTGDTSGKNPEAAGNIREGGSVNGSTPNSNSTATINCDNNAPLFIVTPRGVGPGRFNNNIILNPGANTNPAGAGR